MTHPGASFSEIEHGNELMPTGSEVGNQEPELAVSLQRASSVLPCEAVPYLLSTADALFILLASLFEAANRH
jgi:hypothetical protein